MATAPQRTNFFLEMIAHAIAIHSVQKSPKSELFFFFRPFENLNLQGARAYVGAIHHLHGPDGLKEQIECIKNFLPEFGLAAPCGFGRAPERPGQLLSENVGDTTKDYIGEIIREHTKAVDAEL